ncbi:MAG: hypothetical protein WA414_20960 [Acidobacteriaceae bacterium]
MRGDEERDELITSALRSYAEPEEIPEARVVLARVLERAQAIGPRRRRLWAWAIPVTVCAVALIVAGLAWMTREPRIAQIATTPAAPPVVSTNDVPGGRIAALRRAPRRAEIRVAAAKPKELPKLDVFPSPEPLHPEEQALAFFARPSQAAFTQQVLEAQRHLSDPVDIADLKIRPLTIGDDEVSPTGKEKR